MNQPRWWVGGWVDAYLSSCFLLLLHVGWGRLLDQIGAGLARLNLAVYERERKVGGWVDDKVECLSSSTHSPNPPTQPTYPRPTHPPTYPQSNMASAICTETRTFLPPSLMLSLMKVLHFSSATGWVGGWVGGLGGEIVYIGVLEAVDWVKEEQARLEWLGGWVAGWLGGWVEGMRTFSGHGRGASEPLALRGGWGRGGGGGGKGGGGEWP